LVLSIQKVCVSLRHAISNGEFLSHDLFKESPCQRLIGSQDQLVYNQAPIATAVMSAATLQQTGIAWQLGL